jgi:hippurate hydrolase
MGAKKMVEQGLFERFPCDNIYAFHNEPGFAAQRFGFLAGPVYSSSDTWRSSRSGQGRPWRHAAHHATRSWPRPT